MTTNPQTTKRQPSNKKIILALLNEAHQAEEDAMEFARKAQSLRRKASQLKEGT